jgi:phosphoribosylaminoimidazole-succinocarboxamide synthase
MVERHILEEGLRRTLDRTELSGKGARYEGKVRDNYVAGGRRLLVSTDRLSAFDRVITTLPFKGQVLNRLSAFWFERTRALAPNHLVSVPDPNVSEVLECAALPVEIVVRAYLTGVTSTSIWVAYERGDRVFCGHALPEGLRKNDPLPAPLVTPSTKAPKGEHDRSVSREEILAEGKMTAADFDTAAAMCMALFRDGVVHLAKRGLILVDTKYELGKTSDGTIVVIDEMHTPDSSRIWFQERYADAMAKGADPEGLDKEYLRRWLKSVGYMGEGPLPAVPDEVRIEAARRYIEAYDLITGEVFVPDTEDPLPRMRSNLGIAGA